MSGPPPDPGPPKAGAAAQSRRVGVSKIKTNILCDLQQKVVSRIRKDARASLPGLGVSLLIHLALFVVFALIVFQVDRQQIVNPIELGWATTAPATSPDAAPPIVIAGPTLEEELRAAAREAAMNKVAGVDENAKPTVQPVDVSRSLENRSPSTSPSDPRGEASQNARQSLDRALAWMIRQQRPDGRWTMTGPYPDGAESLEAHTDTGATALALLALLGDGNSPSAGKYPQQVASGVQWLIAHQKPNGDLFDSDEQGRSAHFYAHSQATIALCEALALSGDESLRPAAENAVQFLVRAQNPRLGGWKYRPLDGDGIGDLSVTGWALMAMHTARMARIDVPPETFLLASSFLDSAQVDVADASRYRYRPDEPSQSAQLWSMSAEGLLCRQWLGWPRKYPAFAKGQEFLTSEVNRPVWDEGQRNVYAWYYTAQTLHNLGGDPWKTWFARTQGLLLQHQASGAGKTGGSWNPIHPKGAFLEWSEGAGRLYFTVMCVLILETPERHAPVYPEPPPP